MSSWTEPAMISEVELTNFRKFEDHTLELQKSTVLVGANNAGKSTSVEALRISSFVANRYRSLTYQRVPSWLTGPVGSRGVTPSLRDLTTDLENVFSTGSDPPARIRVKFDGGGEIATYIGPKQQLFSVITDQSGACVTSRAAAHHVEVSTIAVLPQIGPLQRAERRLEYQTVQRGMDSRLSSTHFRNQLVHLRDEYFARFKEVAEDTWPSLHVIDLIAPPPYEDGTISLLVRDGNHHAEVGQMGHGLQMWLQTVWFLVRHEGAPTIVLDEPDVYLHADLQRRLVRLLRQRHQQVVVATHSTEIIAESKPSSIVVVDASAKRSRRMTDISGVQAAIEGVGSSQNLHLLRLANAKRALFVEGKDIAMLKWMHDAANDETEGLGVVPLLEIGGWSGWPKAQGAAAFLRNTAGEAIASYCILDSDYHSPREVLDRLDEAARAGPRTWVLQRKELENYLLDPRLIAAAIADYLWLETEDADEIAIHAAAELERACAEALDDVRDQYATSFQTRGVVAGTASKQARRYVAQRVEEPDGLVSIVPGKAITKHMSRWAQNEYQASIGSTALAQAITRGHLPSELREGLTAIERRIEFPTWFTDRWAERAVQFEGGA